MFVTLTIIASILASALTVSGVSFFGINLLVVGTVLLMVYKKYTLTYAWVVLGGVLHDIYTPGFFGAELISLSVVVLAIYGLTTHYNQQRSVHNMVFSLVAGASYYITLGILSLVNRNGVLRPIESFSVEIVSTMGTLVVTLFISMIIVRILFNTTHGRSQKYGI